MFEKIAAIFDGGKNGKKPSQMDIINAKAALASARTRNLNIIDYQLLEIQKNEGNNLKKVQVQNAKQSIKNAYYALSIIDVVEAKVSDLQLNEELAQGMNDITKAMKLINHFHSRAQKPGIRLFNREYKKIAGKEASDASKLTKMETVYTNVINKTIELDDMVDDGILGRLMNGEDPMECLQSDTSIHAPFDANTMSIDFGELVQGGGYDPNDGFDFDSMSLDDLKG